MPERRSLRSNNKSDASSSANGEKARSNSQSSGAKDKAAPTTRAAANKAKAAPAKKGAAKGASDAGMGEDDKSHVNGSKSTENGVNGSEDVEMEEDTAGAPTSSINSSKNRNGDEKMTVVVPPTKGSKSSDKPGNEKDGDVAMDGTEDDAAEAEPEIDPTTKAIQGEILILHCKAQKRALINQKQQPCCDSSRYQNQLHPSRTSRHPFRSPIYPPCSSIDIVHAEIHHPRGPRRSDCGNISGFESDGVLLVGCP